MAPLHRLANSVVHHPARTLLVLVALSISAGLVARDLSTDMSPEDLYGYGEQAEVQARFERQFGNPNGRIVIVHRADDVTLAPALSVLVDLEARLRSKDYAREVVSIASLPLASRSATVASALTEVVSGRLSIASAVRDAPPSEDDVERVRRAIRLAPMAQGLLVSSDRRVAAIVVRLRDDIDRDPEIEPVVADLEGEVRAVAAEHGVVLRIGGAPFMRSWIIRQVERDQFTLFPGAIVVALLLLLATFRWLPAVVLPALAVGISALLLVGAMSIAGTTLNVLNNIVPILIVIVGISDSIHLVNRYGEELSRGHERRQAAVTAMRSMALSLFLTSATTAVGFASLMVSSMDVLRSFGATAAAGMMIAYVVTIVMLPAVLGWLPAPRRVIADPHAGVFERLTRRLVRLLLDNARWVLVGCALVAGGLGYWAWQVPVDNRVGDQFDEDNELTETLAILGRDLGGVQNIELMVSSEAPDALTSPDALAAIAEVERWARSEDGVGKVVGYPDLLVQVSRLVTGDESANDLGSPQPLVALAELGGSVARDYLSADHRILRLTVLARDIGGANVLALGRRVAARLETALASIDGLEVAIAGEGYVSSHGLARVTKDLLASLLLAAAVIFVFLLAVLRSLRLALASLPPNLLPLVATMAYMHWRGIHLAPATVIIFSVSIGLAVDGTIHVLARFREELGAGVPRDLALVSAAAGSGKAVLVSYLSLILGFLVLQGSGFVPIRLFGELLSVTIGGCLVATLVLLPPLVAVVWPER